MTDKKREEEELLEKVTSSEYKYGFTTDIESDTIPKGLSEEVIKIISAKKNEPNCTKMHKVAQKCTKLHKIA